MAQLGGDHHGGSVAADGVQERVVITGAGEDDTRAAAVDQAETDGKKPSFQVVRPPPHFPQPEPPPGLVAVGAAVDKGEPFRPAEAEIVHPLPHLPQPEAPPGVLPAAGDEATPDEGETGDFVDMSSIGRFIRDRRDAIVRRLSSSSSEESVAVVNEIHLPDVKVVVCAAESTDDDDSDAGADDGDLHAIKGRVSFYSRSGCRDCGAVRAFFRSERLPYVEINLDVFPERAPELAARLGARTAAVPQIFLNDKLLGGLVALNSLRNSGELDRRVVELAGGPCPDTAPSVPVYGYDAPEEIKDDELIDVVRTLRHRMPMQDRLVMLKLVRDCFSGGDLVDGVINYLGCSKDEAVQICERLEKQHFIHHVFRERGFEDGSQHLYRFLEHDPAAPRYYNFAGATNDSEPKPAAAVGRRLTQLMIAILEAYASDDRRHLDYARIAASEEFRRYKKVVQELQRVDVVALPADERTAFFLNLHNAMAIHAVVTVGVPRQIDRRGFFVEFQYLVGGYPYSLSTIKNGVLRSNRRAPMSLVKPFGSGDPRLELAAEKMNPLVHFGICNATRSSPTVRFFSAQGVEAELRHAAREFFLAGGIEIDIEKRAVRLSKIIKWYVADFGQDQREVLKWVLNYLDARNAGLLTHLLNDGGPIAVAYQDYDWSLNS